MAIRSYSEIQPSIADSAYIDPSAVVIGDVTIDEDSSVWPTTVIRGDVHKIQIGKSTNIQDGSVCHVSRSSEKHPDGLSLSIGDEVTVGHRVILHACQVGHRCLIGMGAIVMDGAIIHEHVILGANSLVPPGKTLSSGFLYLGSPAKKIRALTEEEIHYFQASAKHYVALKNRYL